MPQMEMPLFSEDVTVINGVIGYAKREGQVYYFAGQLPLFFHDERDIESFKMILAQLYVTGNATQAEINRTFGLNPINMKRWVKKYKEGGPGAFFKKETNRKPRVLIPEVVEKIQSLLDEGETPSEISKKTGIKENTISKAIRAGKFTRQIKGKKKRN